MIYIFSNKEENCAISIECSNEGGPNFEELDSSENSSMTTSSSKALKNSFTEKAASIFSKKIHFIREKEKNHNQSINLENQEDNFHFSLYWARLGAGGLGAKKEIVNIIWDEKERALKSSGELAEIFKAQGKSEIEIMRECLDAMGREILLSSLVLVK